MGDNHAWLDSKNQFYSSGQTSQTYRSQVYQKNILGQCKYPEDFRRDLLPGRNCSYDTQCKSGTCNSDGVCAGKAINEPCSANIECDINLACIPSSRDFPWATVCKRLLLEDDSCLDDYQCSHGMVCSYSNSQNSFLDVKQCMKKFDISDGVSTGYRVYENDIHKDSLRNGLKCRSGICRYTKATECVCFSIANVTTDYGLQSDSSFFKCSAMSQYNFCQYYYVQDDDGDGTVSLGYLNMECQCSLDGSVGYCPMPAQTHLENYVAVLQQIDNYAQGCHSQDRYNLQAQLECGIGRQYVNLDDIYSLLETKFKFEQWPYAQYQNGRQMIHPCLNKGYQKSPLNMIKHTKLLRDIYGSMIK